MKARSSVYWLTTALLTFGVVSGGVAELVRVKGNVDGILRLGYPLYFITLLGVWKVLGGITIAVPRFPRLKEWAYAGIFFNMTGAVVSHIASGDNPIRIIAPATFVLFTLLSWGLRPQSRVVGQVTRSSEEPQASATAA